MIKSLVLAAVTVAGALGATSANAGVSWSVNINTPIVGTVVSNVPGYYGRGYRQDYEREYGPVYAPTPVYAPAPIYYLRPPVVYYPPAVVYRQAPIVYPSYYPGWRHGHDRWEGRGRGRHDDRHDDHDDDRYDRRR